ncbi:MAG: LacI family transcriptional regulator, partial [Eubacterium sp.]
MKKRKLLGLILSVVMVVSMLAGCGASDNKQTSNSGDSSSSEESSKEVITVGFSQVGAESDWRTANTESMKSTFTEANGYRLIFDDAQQKQENQLTAIRNFIQQEVDYIVLAPVTE